MKAVASAVRTRPPRRSTTQPAAQVQRLLASAFRDGGAKGGLEGAQAGAGGTVLEREHLCQTAARSSADTAVGSAADAVRRSWR